MKEGSPPQPISFFINIPAAGKDPTSCQRAWQREWFWNRQGNKTTKRMMYDLIAAFYTKESANEPRYRVPLGTVSYSSLEGFDEDPGTLITSGCRNIDITTLRHSSFCRMRWYSPSVVRIRFASCRTLSLRRPTCSCPP